MCQITWSVCQEKVASLIKFGECEKRRAAATSKSTFGRSKKMIKDGAAPNSSANKQSEQVNVKL